MRKGFRISMAKTIRTNGHLALCEALIRARNDVGLTQAELAARLRCHQSLVARIESGERRVDVVELVVLARALEASPASLIARVEISTEPEHRI